MILSYKILCCGRLVMSDSSVVVVSRFYIMCVIYVINVSVCANYFSGFICGAGCPVGS